jgi:hypothetical protein
MLHGQPAEARRREGSTPLGNISIPRTRRLAARSIVGIPTHRWFAEVRGQEDRARFSHCCPRRALTILPAVGGADDQANPLIVPCCTSVVTLHGAFFNHLVEQCRQLLGTLTT